MRLWHFFILRKLILQTRMRSHPVELDVWPLVRLFVYFHTSCVRTAKALARLCAWAIAGCLCGKYHKLMSWLICAISSEPIVRGCFICECVCLCVIVASSWYSSYRRPAKAQASLRIRAVSPGPSLFAYIKYGSGWRVRQNIRHLAFLDGCTCAFEVWVYGGRKVPKISWHGSM